MRPAAASELELHCHSTCSDGRLTPEALVAAAAAQGVRLLALTDHDTLAGTLAARSAGKGAAVAVAGGIEISTRWKNATLHLLGYFPVSWSPEAHADFQAWVNALAERRRDRNRRFAAKLRAHGVTFHETTDGPRPWGRAHFAQWLVAQGYAATTEQAFQRYLTRSTPTFAAMDAVLCPAAIAAVKAAGGVASLAHPGRMATPCAPVAAELAGQGLDAIEVYYPLHTPDQQAHFLELAQRYGLQASGGSDFHGRAGEVPGSVNLPEAVSAHWQQLLA